MWIKKANYEALKNKVTIREEDRLTLQRRDKTIELLLERMGVLDNYYPRYSFGVSYDKVWLDLQAVDNVDAARKRLTPVKKTTERRSNS